LHRCPQGAAHRGRGIPSVRGVREPKSAEKDVADRLRSVLPDSLVDELVDHPESPAGPGLGDLADAGAPLRWSDIIPAWPDDVDLGPAPEGGGASSDDGGRAPPAAAVREGTGGFRVGTPWASPPGAGLQDAEPARAAAPPEATADRAGTMPEQALPGVAGPSAFPVQTAPTADPLAAWPARVAQAVTEPAIDPLGLRPAQAAAGPTTDPLGDWPASAPAAPGVAGTTTAGLGEPMKDGFDGMPGNVRRPLAPPSWVLPEEDFEDPLASRPAWSSPEPDDEPAALTSEGAFGGERKFGIRAFDPGRRGVRALAAVAAVAILVAALLAWRARPRVDPVASPSFEAAATAATTPAAGTAPVRGAPSSAPAELVIAVGGKVRKPGLVRLPTGARVADALTAAGGADPGVDVALLNLARKVVDGELILVGVTPPPGVTTAPAAPGGGGTAPAAGGPINLNTATLADLDTLPGVGPVLAQRILDAREAQGGFRAVGDLRKVEGIGDARYEQLKDLVTV
jgi:comEA protein